MNNNCLKACKHIDYCRLDAEKTARCRIEEDDREKLIFGRTWKEIQDLQQQQRRVKREA